VKHGQALHHFFHDTFGTVNELFHDKANVQRRVAGLFPGGHFAGKQGKACTGLNGSVATFERRQNIACAHICSGCQIEEVVDELNLPKQIMSCHPSNLPFPYHVDCLVALNGLPGRLEFSKALFGVHSTFDGSMILFEDVIQVLHGAVSTTIAQRPFLLTVGDRGAVDRCLVGVDNSRLWMG
jgi:hypothetical protein